MGRPDPDVRPAIEAVFTMWPGSSWSSIFGRNARMPWTTPQKLTPKVQRQSLKECSQRATGEPNPSRASSLSATTPALLQRMWTFPYASNAAQCPRRLRSSNISETPRPQLAVLELRTVAARESAESARTTFIPSAQTSPRRLPMRCLPHHHCKLAIEVLHTNPPWAHRSRSPQTPNLVLGPATVSSRIAQNQGGSPMDLRIRSYYATGRWALQKRFASTLQTLRSTG